MEFDRERAWRSFWRTLVTIFIVGIMLSSLLGLPWALLTAGCAAVTLALCALRARVGNHRAAYAAAGVSLTGDILYFGNSAIAAVWMPVEAISLAWMLAAVTRTCERQHVVKCTIALGIAIVLLPLRFTLHLPEGQPAWTGTVIVLPFEIALGAIAGGAGLYFRRMDEQREQAIIDARTEQRFRIARSLHDYVGHELTSLAVRLHAAQVNDHRANEVAALLESLDDHVQRSLAALDEAVSAVSAVDHVPVDWVQQIRQAVERFQETTRAEISLEIDTIDESTLGGDARDLVSRMMLEALTNIRRHAPESERISVTISSTDIELVVTVCNSPHAEEGPMKSMTATPGRPSSGTGLRGLSDEAGSIGGQLTAGSNGNKWIVELRLPLSGY